MPTIAPYEQPNIERRDFKQSDTRLRVQVKLHTLAGLGQPKHPTTECTFVERRTPPAAPSMTTSAETQIRPEMRKPRPIVLLSTFNGRQYIEEQLRSILSQLPADGTILIRDDGSTDGTPDVISKMIDTRIVLTKGANLGFCGSFFALIDAAPLADATYFFCDQDDVWLPGKIERAIHTLGDQSNEIALYCSRAILTNPTLQPIGETPLFQKAEGLHQALTENIATGCTMAFTPALLKKLKRTQWREFIAFHDWWAYVVATTFGKVYFDPTPTMLYRQHGGNTIGMGSGWKRYAAILRYLRRTNWLRIMNRQTWALRKNHWSSLSAIQRKSVSRLQTQTGSIRRLAILTSLHRHRATMLSDVLFRLLTIVDQRPSDVGAARGK